MAGSIEKRGPNKFRLVVSAGLDADKRQNKKTKTVTTKHECPEKSCKGCKKIKHCRARGEAEKELALLVADVERGLHIANTGLTLNEFVEIWLRDYANPHLEPKTVEGYKEKLTRILEAMGHLKIEKIRPNHLMEFYANLAEDGIRLDGKPGGLSPNNIRHHHRTISTIMSSAVQWQIIPFNPASRVKPPKVPKHQAAHYDERQTIALLEALEGEPLKYKLAITILLFTGVREGELMGLEWQDIDFDNCTIEIKRASQYLPGKGVFTKEPKNETSKRVISVPASVIGLLKQYKTHQAQERLMVGDLWQGSKRLFTTWDGQPMHPYTVGAWFPKFLKRHGIPHLPLHGLRHTSASLLIAQGLHAKVISSRLGHSQISTTMDIYGHLLKSADKEASDKLEELLTTKSK